MAILEVPKIWSMFWLSVWVSIIYVLNFTNTSHKMLQFQEHIWNTLASFANSYTFWFEDILLLLGNKWCGKHCVHKRSSIFAWKFSIQIIKSLDYVIYELNSIVPNLFYYIHFSFNWVDTHYFPVTFLNYVLVNFFNTAKLYPTSLSRSKSYCHVNSRDITQNRATHCLIFPNIGS